MRKPETVTLRDLLDADVQVIALERFYPLGGQMVEKGMYRLSDEIVETWPGYFAVIVPVSDVGREIER